MLVPVPLHWRRAWRRRHNQSGALARVIAWQSGLSLRSEVLARVRATEQQIGLSRAQRATNVQGAFQVPADLRSEVKGRHVVLVDHGRHRGCLCAGAAPRRRRPGRPLVLARVVESGSRPI
jgi:predicted amidophosphoribosyltransferase